MSHTDNNLNINKQYFISIVIFFILYCLFLSWSFWFQNVDDAYISFRYGKNLMNGYGLVYNTGEYVEGYTNFLWTIIMSPFTKVHFVDISFFALSFGLIISLFNIYLITLISRHFALTMTYKTAYILLPALFFVLDDSIAFWAIGGMEFPIYTFFILCAVYYYLRISESPFNHIRMTAFLILTTLTRPEGNMIFCITLLFIILKRKEIKDFGKIIFSVIGIYTIFAVIYYGFKYYYYGQIIPNTFYAKGVTDIMMNIKLGSKYLILCLGTRGYIFIFILFIPFRKALNNFDLSYLLVLSAAYLSYIVIVGGDWMFANRFFVPIIPLLYILCTIGFINFLNIISKYFDLKRAKVIANGILILISAALFFVTFSYLEYRQLIIKDENYKYEKQWSMFGKWLKNNASPGTIIAVGPAGKIPYYSELYTIDMWGLNNSYIANTNSKRLQAGHKKFDFEYVLSLKPEYIIGYAGFHDVDVPPIYEKFNAPEDEYKSIDVVFRLKPEYKNK